MGGRLFIAFRWQSRPIPGLTAKFRRLGEKVLKRVGVTEGDLAVLFCDDRTIELLNSRFRQQHRPTDVLSFPDQQRLPEGGIHLGDVAISVETAQRQAEVAGHSLERELAILLIHGILHVCGYDHERDGGEMEALERQIREELL